jgi:formate hydrogenlyase subunit 3/multisubunit Na+/H+ antiporter MnhD subunit
MEMIIGNIIALLFCVLGFMGNVFSLEIKEHNKQNVFWIILLMFFISLNSVLLTYNIMCLE